MSRDPHAVSAGQLQACPECDYPLQGLPDGHRCPECGFAFEPGTQVFPGYRRMGAAGYAITIALLVIVAPFAAQALFAAVSGVTTQFELLTLIAWGGVVAYLVTLLARRRRRQARWYVLLDSRGVTYREGDEEFQISGRQIYAAEYSPFSHSILLMNADGKVIGFVPDLKQPHYREIAALLRAVRDWEPRWQPDPSEEQQEAERLEAEQQKKAAQAEQAQKETGRAPESTPDRLIQIEDVEPDQ